MHDQFRWWYYWATDVQVPPIAKVAKTMKRYLTGILAYLEYSYTYALN